MKSQIPPFFTILGPDFVARKVPLYRRFWEHACGPSDPGVGGPGSCGPLAVINIGTGYLNRLNWLLAGYSIYHRVVSQGFPTHNVYYRHYRVAIWAPATVQYCDRVCIWKFLVRYIVTGCIFCAPSALRQGQVFDPQRHPPPPPGAQTHTHYLACVSVRVCACAKK